MSWQPIETAPKDGSAVYVRRIYEGRLIAEGPAVFDVLHQSAPGRQPLGPDPLGRMTAADYQREATARAAYVDAPRWLRPDRRYAFPEPTEWRPE